MSVSVFNVSGVLTPERLRAYVDALIDLLGDRDPVAVLRRTPDALRDAFVGWTREQIERPETTGKWAARDVVAHLADSELVGGFRLRMVLSHDRPPIAGYDQDRWAEGLRYRESRIEDSLEQFTALRRVNLRIWERLTTAELERVGVHSERGEESLAHMRRLYAGHDLMHLRQLERIGRTVGARALA
jgi:hypothetical protein